jgi:multidrug efflux pump subunit AcrA (membrane-fusion protein)
MRGKWAFISILAVAAGVAAGALSFRFHRPASPPRPAEALPLRSQVITLTGNVRPQHIASVGSAVEGNIEAFLADVGDEVFAGQTLARISSSVLEGTREQAAAEAERTRDQVARAESSVGVLRLEASKADADAQRAHMEMERAQKSYERQATLHEAGATPRLTYEKSQQELDAARRVFDAMDKSARAAHDAVEGALEQVEAARKTLAERTQAVEQAHAAFQGVEVHAPVAGTIVARRGEAGRPAAEAGDQMFQIASDLYALEVPVEPQPQDLPRIRPGQPATVLLLDLGGTGLPGGVKQIRDSVVTVEFAGTVAGIKPGMRAEVRLKLESGASTP